MKPNILLLQCGDLGDHLACYPGNSARTPNLDWLAVKGTVFEQHFAVSPTCSTSQGAMLSGLMPHRNGLAAQASNGRWQVNSDTPILPQILQEAGYTTACFGAWYISDGFWERGIEEGNWDSCCDRAAANATRYLQSYLREQPKEKPFFLMVSFDQPHRPFTDTWSGAQKPEEVILPGYLEDRPEVRTEMAHFYGEVSRVDAASGQVLDALWECGFDENTLVVFTSDCGIGMPTAKGTLYDPDIKIPLIVCWYKRIRGGQRCDALTRNTDLLPTLLEAAGERDRMPQGLDGHSLWPFIERGEDVAHEYIFAEWQDSYGAMRAIRNTRYKLIKFVLDTGLQTDADARQTPSGDAMKETLCNWLRPEIELYDLAQDPWERNNLAGSLDTLKIESALIQELDDWFSRTRDLILDEATLTTLDR
jgi:arylsulfatase A-like enzyme